MDKTEIIKLAAEAGAKEALRYIDQHKRKQIKSRHDHRLRNTRLLLKHYRLLQEHSRNSVYSFKQLDDVDGASADPDNPIDLLDQLDSLDHDTYIQSIKRSATRTKIILEHIDAMMGLYAVYCCQSSRKEDQRRYRVVQARYFNEQSVDDIAADECVDTRTIYRDINDGVETLSALIFGIDGLDMMSQTRQ